jgi:hypothetical protein
MRSVSGRRHRKFARQAQRFVCFGEAALFGGVGRSRERGRADALQAHARIGPIRIQRERRGEQFARARAVRRRQLALRQRELRRIAQLLPACVGIHAFGHRLAERDGQHRHAHDAHAEPFHALAQTPGANAAPSRRSAGEADAAATGQVARRASSTPGKAASLPSRVDSWP